MQKKPSVTSSTEEHLSMPSAFDMFMTVKLQNPAQVVLLQQLKVLNMVTVQNPRLREKCKKYSIIALQVKWKSDLYFFLTTKRWILFESEKTDFIVFCYRSEKRATNIDKAGDHFDPFSVN